MTYESPVIDFLETLGARRAERFGRVTAAHFGDASWEYEAVRHGVGLIDASHLGALRIRGADRTRFLENMLTCSVKPWEPGAGGPAALLTPKGKFIALFRLLVFPESFLAVLDREHVGALVRGLDPFIVLEEVELEDESLRWGAIHVAGPESSRLLSTLSGSPIPHMPPAHFRSLAFADINGPVHAVRDCATGEDGFDLLVAREQLGALWRRLVTSDAPKPVPVGFDAFDVLRVEAGTPLFGRDVGPDLGPLEAGLGDVISWEKGCYPGQEVVAKTRYRGKPPKQLIGLKIGGNEPPAPGTPVTFEGAEVGRITSAVRSPYVGAVAALAVIRAGAIESGVPLRVAAGDEEVEALAAELPFR